MPTRPKDREAKDRTIAVYFRLKETIRNQLADQAITSGETMQEIAERAIVRELDRLKRRAS